ncbi:MAG: chorismate mutase [Clostridia bacterium]|nr:chorismate mutase [Clostridia bacterium]
MKIGYQGVIGSNSEAASIQYVKKNNIICDLKTELLPLVDSQSCVNALKLKQVDFIVMAVKNSIAGTVIETQNAIKNENLQIVDTIILPIHHCLFKKKGVKNDNIKVIASHIQALLQTKNSRNKLFPNAKEKEMRDTALSAKDLSEGMLDETHAVICRNNAGIFYNLELIKENIEDFDNNQTEFKVFKLLEK